MKKYLLITCLIALVFGAYAQNVATRSLASFTEVRAQEGIRVILKKGSKESAKIEASRIAVEDVLTEISGSELKIHLNGDNHHNVEVTVTVTFVKLNGLGASSAASIEVQDAVETTGDFEVGCSSAGSVKATITAQYLEVDVSSAGNVELVTKVTSLDTEISSAGKVKISGSANKADVQTSSSGEFQGYSLVCDKADLHTSSGGSIKIEVAERLEARASSGGSIRYKGSPSYTDVSSSSGGSIDSY